jgi:uncharacterized membrane protein
MRAARPAAALVAVELQGEAVSVDVTPGSDVRLEEFERRIQTLERELADLRALVAASPAAATRPTPAPAPESAVVYDPEELRRKLADLDRIREQALWRSDLPALRELHELVHELEPEFAAGGLAQQTAALEQAIDEAVRFLGTPHVEPPVEPTVPAPAPSRAPPRARAQPAPPAPPRPPAFSFPELSFSDLLGAKALAVAGGIVTLLGIIFFFILAVNRGWIGPGGRVAMGAVAAAGVYAGGLWLRRRYGETDSSLAAVAAGIAGGYAVLLAATALYHFVSNPVALVFAAGIAAVGLVTALRWNSQIVAGIGLLGAMLAPLAIALQGGLSVVGTWFVALMAAATATVAVRQRWNVVLVVGAAAGLAQALALVLQPEYDGRSPVEIVALAAVFAAITVGTGIAVQRREATADVRPMATSFLFVGTSFAVLSVLRLYGSTESRGVALLAVAVALGAVAAIFFPRRAGSDLSALLGALGLVVGGIAFGELLNGSPLAFAWAGEAAVLAWLARQVKDIRYQLWALVYFAAALFHVLAFDAPPSHLFQPLETSAGGALAVVAVGAASAAIAYFTARRRIVLRPHGGFFGAFGSVFQNLADGQHLLRIVEYCLAAAAAVYALSLGVLAAFSSFDWGHVAMYTLWSAIGLGLYVFGLRRRRSAFRVAALGWLVLTNVAAIANGQAELIPSARAAACLVAGVSLLSASLVELFSVLAPRYRSLSDDTRILWLGSAWGTLLVAVAALSVGIVSAVPSYDWGRVAMFSLWSALGLGMALAAFRQNAGEIRAGALLGLLVTDVATIWTGVALLGRDARATSCLIAGLALLTASLVELFLVIAPRYSRLSAEGRVGWLTFAWASAATSVAALSVGVVSAIPSYDWGRVTMFVLWSALGLGVLVAALRRRAPQLVSGGVTALAVTLVVSFEVGERYLQATPGGVTFVVVGASVLLAALAVQLLPRRGEGLSPVALGFVLASVAMGLAAVVALFGGSVGAADERGLAILLLAGLYAVLAAALYGTDGQRDFSTLLWASALVLGYGASERLLPGTYHVLVLSVAATGLAWLSRRAKDPRFLAAAAVALLVGVATVIFGVAPPTHLFLAEAHPGSGAIGALFVAAAAVAVGYLAGESTEIRRRFGRVCFWTAGVLTVYGLSIFILALFQLAFAGSSVDTNFHRGHTAVSAFWGLVGLAALYFGLTRVGVLRVAGFVMFAVSLAKIFLFDLPSLSSITRALSFLAVGVVLLLGGFFYQRLSAAQPVRSRRPREQVESQPGLRRPELVAGALAAIVLIVWFGSGLAPLGLT